MLRVSAKSSVDTEDDHLGRGRRYALGGRQRGTTKFNKYAVDDSDSGSDVELPSIARSRGSVPLYSVGNLGSHDEKTLWTIAELRCTQEAPATSRCLCFPKASRKPAPKTLLLTALHLWLSDDESVPLESVIACSLVQPDVGGSEQRALLDITTQWPNSAPPRTMRYQPNGTRHQTRFHSFASKVSLARRSCETVRRLLEAVRRVQESLLSVGAELSGYTHVYTHVCTHVCTHVYSHVYTHVYPHVCSHVYTHVYPHVYTQGPSSRPPTNGTMPPRSRLQLCLHMSIRLPMHMSTHMSMHMSIHRSRLLASRSTRCARSSGRHAGTRSVPVHRLDPNDVWPVAYGYG